MRLLALYIFICLFSNAAFGFDLSSMLLNENQKKGINEYKEMLGVSVSGNDNSGIVSYFDNLLAKNTCFKGLAEGFYQEIRTNDVRAERYARKTQVSSLTDRVPSPEKNNGDFWKRALNYTNGDKNLAMMLVGVCGHDNILQSNKIICPKEQSNIYYPGSLGQEVDIPNSLKKRITKVQGDNGNADHIPPKYYHIMGAATASCLLLRRGVPKSMAKTIALTAANGYRSGRLCEAIKEGHEPSREFLIPHRAKLNEALDLGPKSNKWKEIAATVRGLSQKSIEVQRRKLEIALSHLDAQAFFKKQSTIFNECKKDGMSGSLISFLKPFKQDKKYCPKSFSQERCQRFLHRLETWKVDIEWTAAQHSVGFDFAVKNCPANIKTGKEIEESACAALQARGQAQGTRSRSEQNQGVQ